MHMVTVDDVRAAAERIRGSVVRTPLVPARWGDPDRPLWLKPENLQAIGAFKVRGAFNAIANLDPAVRARGVVAYSSGNHAQAVAHAAATFGIRASIVMPEETPAVRSTPPAPMAPRWCCAPLVNARRSPTRWWHGPAGC